MIFILNMVSLLKAIIDKCLLQINYSIDLANEDDSVFPIQLPQHNNNIIITTAPITTLPRLQGQ